jgi:hypothetical protein
MYVSTIRVVPIRDEDRLSVPKISPLSVLYFIFSFMMMSQ